MNSRTLDLILIVSATFFVLTDIILALCLRFVLPRYVIDVNSYYAGGYELPFPEAAAKCHCLHKVFPNGTNSNIIFVKDPKAKPIQEEPEPESTQTLPASTQKQSKPTRKLPKLIQKEPKEEILPADIEERFARNPWILSVHVKKNSKWNFRCPGMVLNQRQFIASKSCFIENDKLENLFVRSQSPYYNKLGKIHNISSLEVVKNTWHMFIDVDPPFRNKIVPETDPILLWSDFANWTYATVVTWHHLTEDEPFTERIWTRLNPPSNLKKNVCHTYNSELQLAIVLTNCKELLALRQYDDDMCSTHEAYVLEDTSFVMPECKF